VDVAELDGLGLVDLIDLAHETVGNNIVLIKTCLVFNKYTYKIIFPVRDPSDPNN
jgi:hypothetical protein